MVKGQHDYLQRHWRTLADLPRFIDQPSFRSYVEPDVLFVTDPAADQQALKEAVNSGLPVVGIVDAKQSQKCRHSSPSNNKGRRSLALVYWLLARGSQSSW